ncbi:hypothetical protein HMPREF9622_00238 [Cutibacterium modestum HL037PA3]|uniref:Uncharacterized protein n=1 Tax=Cutibacterium modestum HL044PA1 TaxID=765109 RepID=A0ABP2K3D1_9ACTN|nr:hypothetical protein HMPREF9621_00215 [Cutibacterium modestum HL037PA2]EFS91293.1 hypothetical protein HMPREF9607_02584 [Cutibacterium modestum HL044PA1]EFT16694.1 hypothetical protein HMPREF9622_00238 [Cutibacterium modestum HL037PA3]
MTKVTALTTRAIGRVIVATLTFVVRLLNGFRLLLSFGDGEQVAY